MFDDLKSKILEAYQDGSDLGYISECFNIDKEELRKILLSFRDSHRKKITFTDEFKKIIAERDTNGISRRQIATELDININTVKKACIKFGQSLKDKAVSDNEYTRIDGEFSNDECPSCKSKRVNEVDINTIYCRECGNEHVVLIDHVLKLNWEYLD